METENKRTTLRYKEGIPPVAEGQGRAISPFLYSPPQSITQEHIRDACRVAREIDGIWSVLAH